jgi:hypothetical protein
MKKTVLAIVAGMLLAGPAPAQNFNLGGDPQQRNTKMTTRKTMEIGSDGRPFEKTETMNINLINLPQERKNSEGNFKYSGMPCKWSKKAAKAEKVGEGK